MVNSPGGATAGRMFAWYTPTRPWVNPRKIMEVAAKLGLISANSLAVCRGTIARGEYGDVCPG
jgi:hypothetical protein